MKFEGFKVLHLARVAGRKTAHSGSKFKNCINFPIILDLWDFKEL